MQAREKTLPGSKSQIYFASSSGFCGALLYNSKICLLFCLLCPSNHQGIVLNKVNNLVNDKPSRTCNSSSIPAPQLYSYQLTASSQFL